MTCHSLDAVHVLHDGRPHRGTLCQLGSRHRTKNNARAYGGQLPAVHAHKHTHTHAHTHSPRNSDAHMHSRHTHISGNVHQWGGGFPDQSVCCCAWNGLPSCRCRLLPSVMPYLSGLICCRLAHCACVIALLRHCGTSLPAGKLQGEQGTLVQGCHWPTWAAAAVAAWLGAAHRQACPTQRSRIAEAAPARSCMPQHRECAPLAACNLVCKPFTLPLAVGVAAVLDAAVQRPILLCVHVVAAPLPPISHDRHNAAGKDDLADAASCRGSIYRQETCYIHVQQRVNVSTQYSQQLVACTCIMGVCTAQLAGSAATILFTHQAPIVCLPALC